MKNRITIIKKIFLLIILSCNSNTYSQTTIFIDYFEDNGDTISFIIGKDTLINNKKIISNPITGVNYTFQNYNIKFLATIKLYINGEFVKKKTIFFRKKFLYVTNNFGKKRIKSSNVQKPYL